MIKVKLMVKKRPKCLACSSYLSPWGKTVSGKKRYGCHQCGKTRLYNQKKQTIDLFPLFKQYVLWGHTYEMIASLSGYSIRYLEEKFHAFFEQDLPVLPLLDQTDGRETFLLLDGLWLKRGFILMAYRQSRNLRILHISVVGREVATKIAKDLRHITILGYRFTGIVSDGGTGIVKAIKEVFPNKPHQQCLAHADRDITNAIGRYPKNERVKELKQLANHIWLIESKEALRWWENEVDQWVKKHNNYLKEKKYDIEYNWWYIHKGVRRAISILQTVPETSFTFLNYPLMPKTTNEIEAQFGHLGKRWLAHRGLKKERWERFLQWFVYFYNKHKTEITKTL